MATTRASATYADQPYFNKANDRPTVPRADNENSAPRGNKVTTTYTSANSPVRTAKSNDEIFNETYAKAGIQSPLNRADRTQKASVSYAAPSSVPKTTRSYANSIPKIKRDKKVSLERKLLAKVKVTTANTWIGAWATWWYLGFQMPFAIIGNIAFGFAAVMYFELAQWSQFEGIFTSVSQSFGFETFSEVFDYVLDIIGIPFNPLYLFLIPFTLTFLLGLLQILTSWFIYTTLGVKSLSGKAGWLKFIVCILVVIGYALPLFNLFPLIYLWLGSVWTYPK